MKDIEWRGWQRDLRQYLDKSCDRKVIWVVGKEGNEGNLFSKPILKKSLDTQEWLPSNDSVS